MNGRISARIVSTAVVGSTLLAATSCARETPGHCAFADGDGSCGAAYEGTFCIFQGPGFLEHAAVEYRNVSEAQRLGCYESRPVTPAGEDMGMEFYACVPRGLMDGADRLRDLRALEKGRKDGKTYDLAAFLGDYGITLQVHASGCKPGAGTTTTDTSDSGSTTFGTEGSTTDGVSSESSTTGPMPCMGNEECPELGAPQCVSGECMACVEGAEGDAACAAFDATKPLCAGGTCVQCTPENPVACDEQLLVCNGSTGFCVPCTEHAQCSSGACELALTERLCFPSAAVRLEVDGDGGADHTIIANAIAAVPNNGHGVIVVHELDGNDDYGPTLISGNNTIALLAAPGEAPIIQGTLSPGLRVTGAGTILYIDGLTLAGNTSGLGLRVDTDALAWVDRSRIVQNSGGGILVDSGAMLTLRNCFVGGPIDGDAVAIDGAFLTLAYSTIGAGPAAVGRTRALFCENELDIDVRNSILLSLDDDLEIECSAAVLTNSATEAEVGFNAAWFNNYVNGDFSLSATGATLFADVAQWQTGDPATDIDGDPRPTMSGTPDHAGADLP